MRLPLPLGLMFFALSASCVTINVYFPSAEAAEAADIILERVYGEEGEPGQEQGAVRPELPDSGAAKSALVAMLNFLIPPAQAQADFNISTPASEKLQASLEKRFSQLRPHYESGAVGASNRATVAIRDRNLIPLAERSRVLKLVEEQSRDWDALFAEIARANGNPEWVGDIRETFYERNIARLNKGWWYQDPGGNWKQR